MKTYTRSRPDLRAVRNSHRRSRVHPLSPRTIYTLRRGLRRFTEVWGPPQRTYLLPDDNLEGWLQLTIPRKRETQALTRTEK